jgi:hypothetical protein
MLREHDFPIERIENDFDFDVLLKFLREESEKGDILEDEEIEMFSVADSTQTDIMTFQRKDAQVGYFRYSNQIHYLRFPHLSTFLCKKFKPIGVFLNMLTSLLLQNRQLHPLKYKLKLKLTKNRSDLFNNANFSFRL